MSTRQWTLLAIFLGLGVVPARAGQSFTPTGLVNHYVVARALTPIKIDGHLDEFAWEAAAQINGFERILNDYDQVLFPTRARMLWDDQYLYFAFVCRDADMWYTYDQEDDRLWEEEVVEVFIDPDGDGRNYLELEINPANTVVDLRIIQLTPEWKASKDWDIAGLKRAVQTYGTPNDSLDLDLGFNVEIAIPWKAMADSIDGGGRPSPGDTWRLNLYRIERKGGRGLRTRIVDLQGEIQSLNQKINALLEEAGVDSVRALPSAARERAARLRQQLEARQQELRPLSEHYNEQTEYTAWSETYQRGFHHPARFGVVQFAE